MYSHDVNERVDQINSRLPDDERLNRLIDPELQGKMDAVRFIRFNELVARELVKSSRVRVK